TAVDETAVARRLLGESDDGVAPALDRAVAAGRPHRRDRGELAVAVMEADQFADVHIADAVAIGEAEGILAGQMRADALEAAAGLRVLAGVNERHAPGFGLLLMHDHRVVGHVEGDVRHMQEVVREILLDDVALVATADHEVVGAVRRVDLHDVPEDRAAADLDHRLRPQIALLGDPRAEPAGENDDFHGYPRTAAGD